jgi:hypothetical protein
LEVPSDLARQLHVASKKSETIICFVVGGHQCLLEQSFSVHEIVDQKCNFVWYLPSKLFSVKTYCSEPSSLRTT